MTTELAWHFLASRDGAPILLDGTPLVVDVLTLLDALEDAYAAGHAEGHACGLVDGAMAAEAPARRCCGNCGQWLPMHSECMKTGGEALAGEHCADWRAR